MGLLVAGGLASGASREPSAVRASGRRGTERVTIAVTRYIGACPAIAALRNGDFAAEGVSAELRYERSGRAALEAALTGRAHLATVSEVPVMFAATGDEPVSVVATIASAARDHGILARVQSPAQLRSQRVGVPLRTSVHFFLEAVLNRHGLSARDVELHDLTPDQAIDALARGEIDAFAAWQPLLNRAAALIPGTRVLVEAGVYDIALAVLLTTTASLRKVSRPLARLREGAAIVGGGDLEFHLDVQSRDEIGDLGRAFNEMTARLRDRESKITRAQHELATAQADLARVARVATLGEITASIAHEINQPLGAIANNASAGLRWLAAGELKEVQRSVERVVEDSHRASQIIARIRAMLERAPTPKAPTYINEALEAAVALARAEAARHAVELSLGLSEPGAQLSVDKVQIQQVVLNLIVNAIEAMRTQRDPRRLRLSSSVEPSVGVCIAVCDSGAGLAGADPERIFDAFYTTKPDGIGMGLAVSRSIVEAHRGRLWATANQGRGMTFRFSLPFDARGLS